MPTADDPTPVVEADCFESLFSIADGAFGAVITDPPYSAKTHAGARTRVLSGRSGPEGFAGSKSLIGFDSLDETQFLQFCREAVRVSRRWVVMTCDWRHALLAEVEMPDEFVRCGVWVKPDAAPQFSGDRPAMGWEAVLIMHRPGRKRWNGGGRPAVWTCSIKTDKKHPTQKPLALLRSWIRDFTDPGDAVLDPFAGACTTAVACRYEGRRCLSIERAPEFAAAGRKRLAKLDGTDGALFGYKAPPPDALLF